MFFLTHYFNPPYIPPLIKVGVRYKILSNLNLVNEFLDDLYQRNEEIISITENLSTHQDIINYY